MIIEKPILQREVAIKFSNPENKMIGFYATRDAMSDIKEFGAITNYNPAADYYHIEVDPRYNFEEVCEYIRSYG